MRVPPTAARVQEASSTILVAIAAAVTLGLARPPELVGQDGRRWEQDERVLITSFHELGAVSRDMRRVFAASPLGIQVYDAASARWDLPITAEDGFPTGEQPTALAYDPLLDGLWMGTQSGNLYVYRVAFGGWDYEEVVAAQPIEQILVDDRESDAVFLVVGGGWIRMQRGSGFAERVGASQVPAGVRARRGTAVTRTGSADPYFETMRTLVSLDPQLRRWPIMDIAPADLPDRYWLATRGGGLFYADTRRMSSEQRPFGTLSRGVLSIERAGEELWFGGDGRGLRRGITRAGVDLQGWRQWDQTEGAPITQVRQILATRGSVWFAARDGLYRFDRTGERWERMGSAAAPFVEEITSLAEWRGELWVGGRRGLTAVNAAGEVSRELFPGRGIHRIRAAGDTLWIASDVGVWRFAAANPEPVLVRGSEDGRALQRPALDVLPAAGFLFALADGALHRFDGARWEGPLREPVLGGLRRPRALAYADGQLWVAGDGGVARLEVASGEWFQYGVGRDIPEGPVWSVLPAEDNVWLATPAGALRVRWRR